MTSCGSFATGSDGTGMIVRGNAVELACDRTWRIAVAVSSFDDHGEVVDGDIEVVVDGDFDVGADVDVVLRDVAEHGR